MSRSARKSKRHKRGPANGAEPSHAVHPTAVQPAAASRIDAPSITTKDISNIGGADSDNWPHLTWPASVGARSSGFQAIVKRSVLNAIHRHGSATSDVEVCGVLVGNVVRDDAGPYLIIEASIQGEFAGHSAAQVTFTSETWNHIHGVMDRDHPDQRIVGWYHTHPGFGIFLSDMDLFIHGNFFNLPWQVAMVHDPSSGEDGLFIWRDAKAQRSPIQIEEDVDAEASRATVSPELATAALVDFSRRMQRLEKRQKTIIISLLCAVLIALVFPFVLFPILADRRAAARRSERPDPRLNTREVQPPIATTQLTNSQTPLAPSTSRSTSLILPTTAPSIMIGPATHPARVPASAPTTSPRLPSAPSASLRLTLLLFSVPSVPPCST